MWHEAGVPFSGRRVHWHLLYRSGICMGEKVSAQGPTSKPKAVRARLPYSPSLPLDPGPAVAEGQMPPGIWVLDLASRHFHSEWVEENGNLDPTAHTRPGGRKRRPLLSHAPETASLAWTPMPGPSVL